MNGAPAIEHHRDLLRAVSSRSKGVFFDATRLIVLTLPHRVGGLHSTRTNISGVTFMINGVHYLFNFIY